MNKQELARKRNWFKHQISGYGYPIDNRILTEKEAEKLKEFHRIRKELINEFYENSRVMGLNVPKHRCFYPSCRNKVYAKEINENGYICKKHYNVDQIYFEDRYEIIK